MCDARLLCSRFASSPDAAALQTVVFVAKHQVEAVRVNKRMRMRLMTRAHSVTKQPTHSPEPR